MDNIKKIVGVLEKGSSFLISKEYVLTASHCVNDSSINDIVEIDFKYLSKKKKAILLEKAPIPLDIAILRLLDPFENDFEIKLVDDIVFRGDNFSTYGYPSESPELGKIISGTINDCDLKLEKKEDSNDQIDLKLSSNDIKGVSTGFIEGLSGAPIIISNEIVGIIKNYLGDTLGAQQTKNFKNLLKKYNISYKNKSLFREMLFCKSLKEVNMNKESRKYIPEVYIESNNIKDKIRYFSDPELFFDRLLNRFKNIDCTYLNSNLLKSNLKIIDFKKFEYQKPVEREELKRYIEEIQLYIKNLKEGKIDLENTVVNKKNFNYLRHKLTSNFDWKLKDYLDIIKILDSKILLVLDGAGKGKTTLLCDIVENLFLKKEQLCLFISAYKIIDGDIEKFLKYEFLTELQIDKNRFFEKLEYIAKKEGKKIIVVIDGLNENDNLQNFSINLMSFIGYLNKYENIRVVLSCRKEYFQERFQGLNHLREEKNIYCIKKSFEVEQELEERVLMKYFKYFNIKIGILSEEVIDKLLENPLLLRFFCEAYEGLKCSQINSLYKYDLFQKYTQKIYEKIEVKGKTESELDNIFNIISKYMLESNSFTQIPIDIIKDKNFIKEIIFEEVIFKDGFIENITRHKKIIETISFTFDEYRDYNLAWYIMDNYTDEKILELMESLKNTSVKEGIYRYIYSISKLGRKTLLEKIDFEEWTIEPFLEYVFAEDDSKIESNDLLKLEKIFNLSSEYNLKIFRNLFMRRGENYKNLNINTVFIFIKKMKRKNYIENFLFNFNVNKKYGYMREEKKERIDYYLDKVEEIIQKKEFELAFKLLIIVIPAYYHYDIYYKTKELAENLYLKLETKEIVIRNFLENFDNDLLKEFLLELLKNGKIENRMNYLATLYEDSEEE